VEESEGGFALRTANVASDTITGTEVSVLRTAVRPVA
jgi:hypothetical protein